MAGGGKLWVGRASWSECTPRLVWICLLYSMGSVFFGYDSASFGGVQAFTPFAEKFGVYNSKKGIWALAARTASIMNSLPLLGKLIGTLIVGPIIERWGHKKAMLGTCIVQCIGVIVQCTSHTVAQFTVGRIFIYVAVGLVENIVPTYESELCPAPLRGFCVGSIQLFLTFGSLIAGIVNNEMAKLRTDAGWMIATAIQVVPAVIIMSGLYFTPDSPRWLILKGRPTEAYNVLRQVRSGEAVARGTPQLEITAWESTTEVTQYKAPWMDLFNTRNRRRTGIACSIMTLQQLTGVTFSSAYGPTFYRSVGLGNMAFTYAAINNSVSVVTAIIGMSLLDSFGRRELSLHGCWIQGVFLCVIGALGSKTNPTNSDTHGMVASFIIYAAVLHASLGPAAYITAAEVGTSSLREKTMALSTAVNVVVSFVVVFTTPYLLSAPYAALGAKLGYVWAGFAFLGAVWVFCCMPELKGRTLEEIDQLFDAKLQAWQFGKFETTGLNHSVAQIQAGQWKGKLDDEEGAGASAEQVEQLSGQGK